MRNCHNVGRIMLANKMTIHSDVFRPLRKYTIDGNVNNTFVATIDSNRTKNSFSEIIGKMS